MTIRFGEQTVEVRPWGGEGSGKVLLMTADEQLKRMLIRHADELPDAFEHLPDVPVPDDADGTFLIVADAGKVGLFFDLERMRPGVCVCEDADDDLSDGGE